MTKTFAAWLGIVSTPCAFAGVVSPKITVQPQNQSVLHGNSATFTVVATGTQPLSYQWKYNGLPILSATSSNLVLQGVGSLLVGNYKVTVSNSAGTVTSSNATLSIDVPPSIVVPPIGLSLLAGNSGTLSVVAVGSQPLSYQWYCNGLPLANATSASLALNNAQSASSGSYVVTVSNPLGSVSTSPIFVVVHVPALITVQPLSLAGILGNNLSLSTLAIGDSPLSYRWFFNSNPIAGATNSILNITNALSSQAGNYSVTVNNPFGTSSSAIAKVTLSIPAAIAQQPVEQDVIAGGDAIFSVQGTGTPPLSYQWRLNGSPIPNATAATWILTNVTAQMSGDVSVIVSNLINKIAAQPASLMLASPTLSILAQPANQTVPEGAGVQFSVTASSTSTIRYQWRYKGSDIPAATNSSLSFSRVQAGQAGSYSVLLSDANGILQSTSASLAVSPDVVIARQTESTTVGVNSNVTLSVVAYGSPAINHHWKFNGIDLPGATNANLALANFNAANEGTYRVVVSNFTNSIISSDALLMVGSTPRLLAPLQSKNGAFQFQAAALPNVNYSIQASTDLIQWITISQVNSTNGYISFSDAQGSQTPARYYRLVSRP